MAAWHNELHSHTLNALQDSLYRAIMSTPVYQFTLPPPCSLPTDMEWARLVRQKPSLPPATSAPFAQVAAAPSGFIVMFAACAAEGMARSPGSASITLHRGRGERRRRRQGLSCSKDSGEARDTGMACWAKMEDGRSSWGWMWGERGKKGK